jgi:antitoxin component YwqK of YwqJK toxin-antitoxin module
VAHWGEPGETAEGASNEALSRLQFNAAGQLTDLRCGPTPRLDNEAALCGHTGRAATTELFTERGVLAGRLTHERGQRLRSDTLWDNGQPRSTDVLEGTRRTVRQFSREGVKRKETVREANRPLLEQDFSERGTLVAEKRWNSAGQLEREAMWFLNGQLQRELLHEPAAADGARAHVEKGYRDDGRLAFEGRYTTAARGRTVPVGSHKRWDEAGRLRVETVYDDQGRPKRERSWDDNGRVQRDDEVFEDGSRRATGR